MQSGTGSFCIPRARSFLFRECTGTAEFRAGLKRRKRPLQFVRDLIADCGSTPYALENPMSIISTRIRPKDQAIQPYEFGHDASKTTWLWLNKLPHLETGPKNYIAPRMVCQFCRHTLKYAEAIDWRVPSGEIRCHRCDGRMLPRWANQTDSGQDRLAPSEHRATDRARTYAGIAKAMAEQWG